jgi:hypothetical protein
MRGARKLQTNAGEVRLQVPKLRQQTFEIGEVFICIGTYSLGCAKSIKRYRV